MKTYVMGDQTIHAVSGGIDIEIKKSEYVAIMGPSGSGKSTLMNLIGCLDSPTSGLYYLNGKLVSDMDDDELARIRNKEIRIRLPDLQSVGADDGAAQRGAAADLCRGLGEGPCGAGPSKPCGRWIWSSDDGYTSRAESTREGRGSA